MEKKLIKKAIFYRLFAFTLGQIIAFILFKKVELNLVVAFIDGIQTIGYYFFEKLWRKRNA